MPKVVITIRVEENTKGQLINLADLHQRSLSETCEKILQYGLKKYPKAREGNRTGLDLLYVLGLSETPSDRSTNG